MHFFEALLFQWASMVLLVNEPRNLMMFRPCRAVLVAHFPPPFSLLPKLGVSLLTTRVTSLFLNLWWYDRFFCTTDFFEHSQARTVRRGNTVCCSPKNDPVYFLMQIALGIIIPSLCLFISSCRNYSKIASFPKHAFLIEVIAKCVMREV